MSINDGGPAFLIAEIPGILQGHPGMTLRDWFAGQVLAAACSEEGPETAAILAYEYADAMLTLREVKP